MSEIKEASLDNLKENYYEILVNAFIETHYIPGTTFIDGGANYGLHIPVILTNSPQTNHVLAIEPNQELANYLRKKFNQSNFECLEFALGSSEGNSTFYLNDQDSGYSSLIIPAGADRSRYREVSVQIETLDRLMHERPGTVSVIKLDLEGAEFLALKGASEILMRDRPFIVIEYSTERMRYWSIKPEEFEIFLSKHESKSEPIIPDLNAKECWYLILRPLEKEVSERFVYFRRGIMAGINHDDVRLFTKLGIY